ncbi:hypothetical protein LTR53_008640 [Teratosphaeriaceae sp. CCFEE 6253]|nr:hypothetical protein LTR53_008640 [Teratosphaeriaceae sp. CCFEE 6253]
MADDTRQPPPTPNASSTSTPTTSPSDTPPDLSREALTVDPSARAFTGTQWQGGKQIPFKPPTAPPQNANLLSGGTENTAGGKVVDPTVGNALAMVSWDGITALPSRPCVRDALLTGLGGGFVMGGVRAVFGAAVWNACSWAVASTLLASSGMYQYCYYRRHAEKEGMLRVVEIMQRKEVERKAREQRKGREKVKEERREAKDVEIDGRLAALKEKRAVADGGGADVGGASREGGGAGAGQGRPWWKVW